MSLHFGTVCSVLLLYTLRPSFLSLQHLHLRNQIHFNATGLLFFGCCSWFSFIHLKKKKSFMIKCLAFLFSLLTAHIQNGVRSGFDTLRIYKWAQQNDITYIHTQKDNACTTLYTRCARVFSLSWIKFQFQLCQPKIHVAFCSVTSKRDIFDLSYFFIGIKWPLQLLTSTSHSYFANKMLQLVLHSSET